MAVVTDDLVDLYGDVYEDFGLYGIAINHMDSAAWGKISSILFGTYERFSYICQRNGISISVVILSTMTCWD